MKAYQLFIPANFILSTSTALLAWGVRIRADNHDGFCSDPWGADWYVLWFISSLLYGASLMYSFLRGNAHDKKLNDWHGVFFVLTCVFTFILFAMGFLYFSKPDKSCDSLKVFDSILWALGIIGAIVLYMKYPNKQTKAVIPQSFPIQQGGKIIDARFKNLRY